MARFGGIHTIALLTATERAKFEEFMTKEAFPAAAEAPGSVSRDGRSMIKSQHLLKVEGDSREYLWLIKADSAFQPHDFLDIFDEMYQTVREKLEAFASRKCSTTFGVMGSLDVGARDTLGRPTGSPIFSDEI